MYILATWVLFLFFHPSGPSHITACHDQVKNISGFFDINRMILDIKTRFQGYHVPGKLRINVGQIPKIEMRISKISNQDIRAGPEQEESGGYRFAIPGDPHDASRPSGRPASTAGSTLVQSLACLPTQRPAVHRPTGKPPCRPARQQATGRPAARTLARGLRRPSASEQGAQRLSRAARRPRLAARIAATPPLAAGPARGSKLRTPSTSSA